MKFTGLIPSLLVEDIDETMDFYRTHFGFEVLSQLPSASDCQWALMKRNDVVVMFQSKASIRPDLAKAIPSSPGGGMSLFIKVDQVADLYDAVVDQTEMVGHLEQGVNGHLEFTLVDPNGYFITFSEPEPSY